MSETSAPLEITETSGARQQALADCGLILLAAVAACFLFLGQNADWAPREARHGVIAAEMAQSGDYFVPRLLGELYEYKPPVLHALAAVLFNLFGGPSMLLLRLPLAVAACCGALALCFLGRILFNRETGLFASLALLGSQGFAHWSHTARPDMIFAAALVGQSLGLVAGMAAAPLTPCGPPSIPPRGEGRVRGLPCFFLAGVVGGVALLTKGPYGISYVGLFALALILAAPWGRQDLRRPRLPELAIFGLGLVLLPLAWALPIYLRGDMGYLRLLFSQYNPAAGIRHRHGVDYYFVHGLAGVLPWALFLPLAVKDIKKQRALTVFVAAIFAVFSCIPSKEERYLLPWYPFAVLLLTAPLVRRFEVRWLRNACLVLLLLGLAAPPVYYGLLLPRQSRENPQVQAFATLAVKSVPAGSAIHCLGGIGETVGFMAYALRAPGEVLVTATPDQEEPSALAIQRAELRAVAAQRVTSGKSFFVVVKEGKLQGIQAFFPEAPLERIAGLRVQQQAGHQSIPWLLCRVPLDAATAAKIKEQAKPSPRGMAPEPGED